MSSDEDRIREERAVWREDLERALDRFPETRERFETISGIEMPRVLTPLDRSDEEYVEDLGFPGRYPFTRGVQPTMYRARHWTMRQYAGFTSAAETNRRFHHLLEQGQTGLSVAFDLPTQIGYDSDHGLARGEVGKVGVPISCLDDMRDLLRGIPLDEVSVSMTINSTAVVLLAFTVALADERGVDRSELRGTLQNDILKEYIARGTFRFPPGPSLRIVTDIIEFCTDEMPRWNPISISGYHIREAGSTAPEELGFTLANAIAYAEAACERGLDFDAFAPRLSFFFNAHSDFLEEIAKFRAARRLWARIARDRFGAERSRSMKCRFHVQTAGSTLTAVQPDVNVVRVALQAMSAVLGGTQSLHTNGKDEALSLPTEHATTLALRTQQVIAHESGVTGSVDPLGGAWLVEHLTDRLEERARELIDAIDERGGAVAATEAGWVQARIQDSAFEAQRAIEEGERVVVGVNEYVEEDEEPASEIFLPDPEAEDERRRVLAAHREARDDGPVEEALDGLDAAARTEDENLVPPTIRAVKAGATLGEICEVLSSIFGEHTDRGTF